MDGVLVIDKPSGPTSHDVVAIARRVTGQRRVGHTGTLDPLASGVLPLVLGRATRLAQFLSDRPKTYVATVRLGLATSTYDVTGEPIARVSWTASPTVTMSPERPGMSITDTDITRALDHLQRTPLQRPPAYSAKKIGGRRAYDLARSERPVVLDPVAVTLEGWRLVARRDETVVLDIQCSAGYYVRSLAHDLGVALGCGAHLTELRRTHSAGFPLDNALALSKLTDGDGADAAAAACVPMDRLLLWLPCVALTARGLDRVRHGQPARPEDLETGGEEVTRGTVGPIRLIAHDGALIGLARSEPASGFLHPFLNLV